MSAGRQFVDSLWAQSEGRAGRLLSLLLQQPEIVELIGPADPELLAALDALIDEILDEKVAQACHALAAPIVGARTLLANVLREGSLEFVEVFAECGASAADLADRVTWGSPRPVPPSIAGDTEVLLQALNDDYTPMEFVVDLLESRCGLGRQAAVKTMLQVHHEQSAPVARLSGSALALLAELDDHCRAHLVGLRFRIDTDPERIARFIRESSLPVRSEGRFRLSGLASAALFIVLVGVALQMMQLPRPNGAVPPMPAIPEKVVPTAAQRQQIAAAFAPYLDALRASERDFVKIEVAGETDDEPWSSKLGGTPYLPAGATLPEDPDRPGIAMALLVQIDFAELPSIAGNPRRGLLQVFLADDPELRHFGDWKSDREIQLSQQRYFRMVYWPERGTHVGSSSSPRAWPLSPEQPVGLRFSLGREAITPADSGFVQTVGVNPFELARRLAKDTGLPVETVADELPILSGSGHKLGGYPDFAQDDPRSPGTRLRLLLQLDSDEHLMWGDAGVGSFFIDPVDLERADFSRVMFSWDSH